jgi:hypothetical protein
LTKPWSSNGGTGKFRYSIEPLAWFRCQDGDEIACNDTSYTPSSFLPEGVHTLIVTELYDKGDWSKLGSHSIEIDSGTPCSKASSDTPIVDDSDLTIAITYTADDIYKGQNCDNALSGSGLEKVELWVQVPGESGYSLVDTDPEDALDGEFEYTVEREGRYQFSTRAFDKAGNSETHPDDRDDYDTETIYFSTFSGYAILAVGSIEGEEGIDSHTVTANNVYRHLINRNFGLGDESRLDHIKYLNPYDPSGNVTIHIEGNDYEEGKDYRVQIENAIAEWTLGKMKEIAGPLYIVLIDHGGVDKFYLNELAGSFTSSDLDDWINILEQEMAKEGIEEKIVIILGTCYSGSFINELSKPGRIILTSAAEDETSFRGPDAGLGAREGEFFMSALFNELGRGTGTNLSDSFRKAVQRTDIHTDSGMTDRLFPYFDTALQHPHLDDNGDGQGGHGLSVGGDGIEARSIFLGYATNTSEPVVITEVGKETDTPLMSTNRASVWAKVSDYDQTSEAWVQIREPDYIINVPKDELPQQKMELIDKTLEWNGSNERYEFIYDGFKRSGTYTLFFYARDKDTGIISPFVREFVYKWKDGNNPPGAFNLISPENGASLNSTGGLDFVWEESVDPDGDAVTYTLEIWNDLSEPPSYKQEGLVENIYMIRPDEFTFKNNSSYFWQVTAVDQYGAETLSNGQPRRFQINNENPDFAGRLEGKVYDKKNRKKIKNAVVHATPGGLSIESSGGGYVAKGEKGTYTFHVSADGYYAKNFPNVEILEREPVPQIKDFGLTSLTGVDEDVTKLTKLVVVDKMDLNKDRIKLVLFKCERLKEAIETLKGFTSPSIDISVKADGHPLYTRSIPWSYFEPNKNETKYKLKDKKSKEKFAPEKHNDKLKLKKERMKFKIKNAEVKRLPDPDSCDLLTATVTIANYTYKLTGDCKVKVNDRTKRIKYKLQEHSNLR